MLSSSVEGKQSLMTAFLDCCMTFQKKSNMSDIKSLVILVTKMCCVSVNQINMDSFSGILPMDTFLCAFVLNKLKSPLFHCDREDHCFCPENLKITQRSFLHEFCQTFNVLSECNSANIYVCKYYIENNSYRSSFISPTTAYVTSPA